MADPCVAERTIYPAQLRRYSLFKGLIQLLLLALVGLALMRACATVLIPAITSSAANITTGEQFLIEGTGTAGGTVELLQDGFVIGETAVDDDGIWRFRPALSDAGQYEFAARGVAGNGTKTDISNRLTLVVSEQITNAPDPSENEPETPTVTLQPATIDQVSLDNASKAATLAGSGTAGAILDIINNGRSIEQLTVGDNGIWVATVDALDINNSIVVRSTMPDGTVIGDSPAREFSFGEPDAAEDAPVFVEIGTTPNMSNATATGSGATRIQYDIQGIGTPDGMVRAFLGDVVLGDAVIDASGEWQMVGSAEIESGPYTYLVRLIGEDGSVLSESSTLQVDVPDLSAVVVEDPPEEEAPAEEPAEEPTEEVSEEETPEEEVVEEPAEPVGDGVVTIVEVVESAEAPTIGTVGFGMTGTGRPDTQIEVLNPNDIKVGGATVQTDGTWSCECTLPPGVYNLSIQEVDAPDTRTEPVQFVVENTISEWVPYETQVGAPVHRCDPTMPPPEGVLTGTVYKVAPCEYLDLIAVRLQTTVADLITYNPQLATTTIYADQLLNVPLDAGCFDTHDG